MLDIDGLAKRYGDTRALNGISMQVRPGELYGFVGSNGAGKSTTMRIAMGVLAADSGTVRWQGEPITFATRLGFGYMPEQRGLYPKMRIAEQVAYFGRLHGMPAADAERAAARLLERLEVKAAPHDLLQTLSLGNQQRVQLAAALVHDPRLLILDEPFSGLDPIGVDRMAAVLDERCRAGVAVIFSSHQLELVERLCQRIGIIADGRMVAQGTIAELRANGAPELEVAFDGGGDEYSTVVDGHWLDAIPGARVAHAVRGVLRVVLDDPRHDQAVLAAAARAGRVARFGWREPPLAELYRSSVTSSEPRCTDPEREAAA